MLEGNKTVIVCGGRNYIDHQAINHALDQLRPTIGKIIHGGARGADTIAGEWADHNHIEKIIVKADWDKYGKSAGMIRNRQMLEMGIDIVIAFPGGRGTANMVDIATQAGVKVIKPITDRNDY